MSTPNAKRNCDLPADVIEEILLRLPVKTLSRFKCVCKHWYTLIESPSFVKRHFGHESNQERLLVRLYKPNEDRYAFALYVDEMLSGCEEPNHLQMPDTIDEIIGPVNGVFCVGGPSRVMALLNPAMRQFKPISLPYTDIEPHLLSVDSVLGFGLDLLSGDYKVVSIQYLCNEETDAPHYPPFVYVYNSGSDSWRHFEDVGFLNSSYCVYRSLCNTYLDGFHYWPMEFHNCNVAAILAFDMTNEKFKEIQVPDCVKTKTGRLALHGDSIALLSYDLDKIDKCVDVWVMKKEGCWTKAATVGPFEYKTFSLGFWKNSELLLERETSVVNLYDVYTQKLRPLAAPTEINYFIHWVFSYKESLVSIKGLGDDCMLWDPSSDFVKYFFQKSSSSR